MKATNGLKSTREERVQLLTFRRPHDNPRVFAKELSSKPLTFETINTERATKMLSSSKREFGERFSENRVALPALNSKIKEMSPNMRCLENLIQLDYFSQLSGRDIQVGLCDIEV